MVYRLRAWTLGIVLLAALSSPARAAWTLVSADSPVTVVRAANVFELGAGESLRADDLVLSPRQGVVQIQDDNGTLVALGAQSRLMLQSDERIDMLGGWMKIAPACKAAPCPQRIVETERGAIRLSTSASAAAIVATPGDAGEIADSVAHVRQTGCAGDFAEFSVGHSVVRQKPSLPPRRRGRRDNFS